MESESQRDVRGPDKLTLVEHPSQVAIRACQAACSTRDLKQFNDSIEEFYDVLGEWNTKPLLTHTFRLDFIEGARALLEKGIDPNSIPLTTITRSCRSVGMLELLSKYGLAFTAMPGGDNPLDEHLDRKILDWLLDHGLDINGGTNDTLAGSTGVLRNRTVAVLNRAAGAGDIELFDHLVDRGADPSRSDALCEAACSENASAMITHLITKYNIDVDANDECNGMNELSPWYDTPGSALNYAVTRRNIPAIETLLKYGAKIGYAYQIAMDHEDTTALKLLLDAGLNPSDSLASAIVQNNLEAARLCLEYGADFAATEANLMARADKGAPDLVITSEMGQLMDEWKEEHDLEHDIRRVI